MTESELRAALEDVARAARAAHGRFEYEVRRCDECPNPDVYDPRLRWWHVSVLLTGGEFYSSASGYETEERWGWIAEQARLILRRFREERSLLRELQGPEVAGEPQQLMLAL